GNVDLQSGSTLSVGLNSPYTTAGTDYGQLVVTGTVNLAGARLNLFGGIGAPGSATPLTLISNDLSEAGTGTFNGLVEGATVTVGNFTATISYVGGRGNDVVLLPQVTPNQPPTIAANSAAVTANEGGTATNTGTFFDPDGNSTVTVSASVGTVTQDNA